MSEEIAAHEKALLESISLIRASLPCCWNCDHFDKATELCIYLDVSARPPAKIMCFGCKAFVQEIPF
jgi:hypothetical protein